MTWQRIDENTYIDDTLVTCAEYQLFIDEMRQQGNYHQPDHWTSYQFPSGEARDPILGVRHSDVVAFCNWLTQAKNSEWNYRLPNLPETEKYLLKPNIIPLLLGYWTVDINGKSSFAWVGPVPSNPRQISAPDLANDLARLCNLEIAHNLTRTLSIDRLLDLTNELSSEITFAFGHIQSFAEQFKLNLNSTDVTCALIRNLALDRDFNRALDVARNLILSPTYGWDHKPILDLYHDLYTLQERIAGRSPAFEGIRLVKERIK